MTRFPKALLATALIAIPASVFQALEASDVWAN